VAQIVEPAQRRDVGFVLGWAPVARAPVVQIQVAALGGGEHQRALVTMSRKHGERVERRPLQRHGPGRVGLRRFDPVDPERSPDMQHARVQIDVAPLERKPLPGCKPVAAAKRTIGP
jgi:hypothetical protein